MQGLTRSEYDIRWANKLDDTKTFGPMSRHVRRLTKQMVRPLAFQSLLDVGCGQGSLLKELTAEFPTIEPCGVDISSSALELAQSKVPYGQFWTLDVSKEHLTQRFDLVTCIEVLEHIPDDVSALSNLAQMTGRHLVAATLQGRMRRFETQVGHVRNYTRNELLGKIKQSGLHVVRVLEWGFPFYSPIYRNFLETINARGTTGELGVARRMISSALYYLFLLNSSNRGDMIFVLAKRP